MLGAGGPINTQEAEAHVERRPHKLRVVHRGRSATPPTARRSTGRKGLTQGRPAPQSVVSQGRNVEDALFEFLREYRVTPHVTTGVAPSEVYMFHCVRNTLPQVTEASRIYDRVAGRLRHCQVQNERVSHRRRARVRNLRVGDMELVKNRCPGVTRPPPLEEEDSEQMLTPAESAGLESRWSPKEVSVSPETQSIPECGAGDDGVVPHFSNPGTMTAIRQREGGARYDLRPRPAAPVRLQDYVCK
ncbi:hypothetical protein NDU88_000948 [Pleurodeles waltl]|uniref:Uncharacterized protein n=1 Tax=Pleurodeles waltl TaxID=8319 RepID=A0AAV7WKH0_PLEWA|nr:hypothetical protein NDU88_000948 [Pleurodeles waltl]